jgi:hypothetical protein
VTYFEEVGWWGALEFGNFDGGFLVLPEPTLN